MLEVRVKRKLPGFNLDVAFSVNQEILSILGPSGSGKTMTLQCIAGLIRPDEGYIKLNNKVLLDSASGFNLPTQMRKVGFVFQDYALFPHLTVDQNIGYGIRHLTAKRTRDRIAELRDRMNIQKLGGRYPRQLSAGQQQRVAVARALAPEPEVLLLDEPFSALDSLAKERLQLGLQELHQFYNGNILFVTHDLAEGYKLGSKMAVFESGRVAQHDDKDQVVSCPSNHIVAGLVGFKNLIEGDISRINSAEIWITVNGWCQPLRALNKGTGCLSVHQHVTVGIRPEHIQLGDEPGENTFPGTVDQIVEGISSTKLRLLVGTVSGVPNHLEAVLPRSTVIPVANGHQYYLSLPPERLAIIPG